MTESGDYEPSPADYVREQVETYERTGGAEGNTMGGKPVIILTTIGAKTGKVRKTPLMRVEHEGHYAVVASKAGARPIRSGTTTSLPTRRSRCRTVRQRGT